jgi:dipeptidyl aminopeptidase/acylaminoacyl peptidase
MRCFLSLGILGLANAAAQIPDNLTVEDIPPISPELRANAARFMEFRTASFLGWHPQRREMLISTRFAETAQLHVVRMPGGARRQTTFASEPVRAGSWQPKEGKCIVFAQDTGGGEFYQLYRLDDDGRTTLLTDGKSRNTGAKWARSGSRFAYASTRRNGKDNDIHVQQPFDPASAKLVLEVSGGGWGVLDWSHDEKRLLLGEYLSANESRLHILDLATGKSERLSPEAGEKVVWSGGQFSKDDASVITITDRNSEFRHLAQINVATKVVTVLPIKEEGAEIEEFELAPDGKHLAYAVNREGTCELKVVEYPSGTIVPSLFRMSELGVVSGLQWRETSDEIGFSFNSPRTPTDAFSLPVSGPGAKPYTDLGSPPHPPQWTESETGGLNAGYFAQAELVRITSFDGTKMSGFLYRPDAKKFPGKRPCVVNIHGGPEGQSQPEFVGRWNFLTSELGVAIFYPNVRGSAGFGKTFIAMDNGFKREDSVRDIGAFLEALKRDPGLDADRFAVMGGSYGGYMTLAALIHHSAQLRCGIDVVGISNFLTFLKNTQDYRRDLRRVEYGDEREPKMAEHLAKISPTARAGEIKDPLFVVQGKNDPRVPVTEARQMAEAVRKASGKVWYLEAADEGHGFAKKKNADFMFLSVVQFLQEHLLK